MPRGLSLRTLALVGRVTLCRRRAKAHLYTVDTALQESKELLRLAHDLKYSAMNARHYGESCRKLKEIGVMLGELIEEVKTRK